MSSKFQKYEENEVVIVETETQRKWRIRNEIIAADTGEVIYDLVKELPVGSVELITPSQ